MRELRVGDKVDITLKGAKVTDVYPDDATGGTNVKVLHASAYLPHEAYFYQGKSNGDRIAIELVKPPLPTNPGSVVRDDEMSYVLGAWWNNQYGQPVAVSILEHRDYEVIFDAGVRLDSK